MKKETAVVIILAAISAIATIIATIPIVSEMIKNAQPCNIDKKHQEDPWLGKSFQEIRMTPNGRGFYQPFEYGSIYCIKDKEPFVISGEIRDKWAKKGWENGPLGFPTKDVRDTINNLGKFEEFENGAIYYKKGTSEAFMIQGRILYKWRSLDGENGPLGFPISDESPLGGVSEGRYNLFENGIVCYSPERDAYEIIGNKNPASCV